MNLKVISVCRHFIVFVLLWKISYQAILWCAFTYRLAWALIALCNGTSVPIKLHIIYLKVHDMVPFIFFEKDFLACLVKISLRTSSMSSEKQYGVHRLWNIGQKWPCQWIKETLSTRKWLNLSPPLDVCTWCHMGSFYSSRLLTRTMFYRVAQTRKAPRPQLCPRVTNINLTV